MRQFSTHDEAEMQRLREWQRQVKTKGANKDKPERPDIALWFPPSDVTNPAFLQNAQNCETSGHTQYFNMPEIEQANRLCGGHRQVSQILRSIYDVDRAGALRATADGVTCNPVLRVNITLSSTPSAAREFYRRDMSNGTFSRVPFSYRPRTERSGVIPKQGQYSDKVLQQLDGYINKLSAAQGDYIVPQLNRLISQQAFSMRDIADLADDDLIFELSHRSLVNAWKCGCILYLLNDSEWTRGIGQLVEWLIYHDLWSKIQVFADLLKEDKPLTDNATRGPKNMLEQLPDTFSKTQLQELRMSLDKPADCCWQIHNWLNRGLIEKGDTVDYYRKTDKYLNRDKS